MDIIITIKYLTTALSNEINTVTLFIYFLI